MYGAANVGSLMRRSHHTKNPSLPLATLQVQCQPVNSAKQITAQAIARVQSTALRCTVMSNPPIEATRRHPPQFSSFGL